MHNKEYLAKYIVFLITSNINCCLLEDNTSNMEIE